jgi:hypothetical protein
MDLISHILHHVRGLRFKYQIDDDFLVFKTKRDLYSVAKRFKALYDVDICNLGYSMLHIKLLTDNGIVEIDILRNFDNTN